jgi:hypothetical protein
MNVAPAMPITAPRTATGFLNSDLDLIFTTLDLHREQ